MSQDRGWTYGPNMVVSRGTRIRAFLNADLWSYMDRNGIHWWVLCSRDSQAQFKAGDDLITSVVERDVAKTMLRPDEYDLLVAMLEVRGIG
jgi:hypothetical protein